MSLNKKRIKENQGRGFYLKNLSILKKRGGLNLVEKIEKMDFSPSIQIIQSKIGLPTVRIGKNGGEGILIHSAYDPVKEAKNFISNYKLEKIHFLIVLGFGLGYHIKEILDSYPQVKLIIVIEPNLSLFKTALNVLDLSSILSSPKVKLLIEDDPLKIEREMLHLGTLLLIDNSSIIIHKPSFNLLKEKLNQIKKSINNVILWSKTNLTTNIVKGDTFQRNILTNIPQIINNPGVKNLFGKFKDKPVICVAAGPSLDKNIHLLKKAKNKALIICVDAALRTMIQQGIEPDIVVSIDYSQGARNLFEGVIDQTKNLFLAADPEVCPDVVYDFKGKKFIISINKPIVQWLNRFIEDKGSLDKGISVAHTVFSLAKAVGGDPIIFVGQDLSYPEGVTHAGGAIPRKKIAIGIDQKTGKKYLLVKTKNGEWRAKDLVMVKDIYGKEVPTSMDMYCYLIYLERMVSVSKVKCIDATEGGARIRGTEVMSLKEAIDKYCREPIAVRQILQKAVDEIERADLQKLKEEMKKTIEKLRQVHFFAGRGQRVIKKLTREIKQKQANHLKMKELSKESNNLVDKITKIEPHIQSFLEQNMYSYLYLAKRKENLILSGLKGKKRLITHIEKVGIFYDGVKKATDRLIDDFQFSLQRLNSTLS